MTLSNIFFPDDFISFSVYVLISALKKHNWMNSGPVQFSSILLFTSAHLR